MQIFQNYNNYKKFEGEYKNWQNQKDLDNAKKAAYLKQNPVSEEEKQKATQKGQTILRAVDIMDEYSQSKAEDAEVVTEQVGNELLSLAMMVGMIGGAFAVAAFKRPKALEQQIQKKDKGLLNPHLIIPFAVGMAASVAASIPILSWTTQIQVGASRRGRFESIRKELNNAQKFAVLDDKQSQQLEELAKNVPVDEEMKKQLKKRDIEQNPFTFFATAKELLTKNKDYDIQKEAFNSRLEKDKNNFNLPLTNKETLDAKKDQQLLLDVVQKVDIASQDYAENVELATNSLNFATTFLAMGAAWGVSKILEHAKIKNKTLGNILPWGTALVASLGVGAYTTSVQKQASRIGRFKVKQELEKDPNNFVYIDDEKIKAMPDVPVEKPQKPGFFKFMKQVMKDHKEYKKYLKTEAIKDKQRQKALDQIELSDEQIQEAKRLQHNTFKTFNKVDDNSQKYAESVEAVGQIVQSPIANIGTLAGMAIGTAIAAKRMKKLPPEKIGNDMISNSMPIFLGVMIGALPAVGFDIYITKEQKKASRIADMMAIKELSDYRNFADYQNKK